MSSRDRVEPADASTETRPLPTARDGPGRPGQEADAEGHDAAWRPEGAQVTEPAWGEPARGWDAPAQGWGWRPEADQPAPPAWGEPAGQAGAEPAAPPVWGDQAGQPAAPATTPGWQGAPDQGQPGWGQGGGWGGPGWGERAATPASPRGRTRVNRWLAGVVAGLVLLAGGIGIGKVLDRNNGGALAATGAGIPTAAAPAPPVKGGTEPVAAVASALLPTVVQLERNGGLGSGVIYDKNGYILTAAHVVEGTDTVTVRLANGTRVTGRVLGTDDANDVGVVKIDARADLKAAPLALGVKLDVGQTAVAIGSPFGLSQTVTAGVVSATSRALQTQDANGRPVVREVLQTDAPINPGNSGGALANRAGQVIGINDAIESQSGGNVGVGFAIPIDIAARSAAAIVKGQPIRTGYLGVSTSDPTTGPAGALIREVVSGSPADKAGLKVGDLITAVNGQPVQSYEDLGAQVRSLGAGQRVQLKLVRDGSEQTVTATLAEVPQG